MQSLIIDMEPLKILNENHACTGCGACVSACPRQALTLEYNEEGFYYPMCNKEKCISCRICEKVCHVLGAPISGTVDRNYTPFMIKAKSARIVDESSSGGVFTMLSEWVLKQRGVVYGARYNYNEEKLEHCSTEKCALSELRKSKYIESYMGDTYVKVLKDLKAEKPVLFCGTPCQVKGLKTFLDFKKVNQEKLLLVRFICHGVPSNKFFTEYKHFEERRYGGKVVYLDFRPKNRGWRTSNLLLKFSNGKVLDQLHLCNYYYYYYQHNYLLRKCCYNCMQLCDTCGDFTIADFWGIHFYQPTNPENRVLSLVLAHSEKSLKIIPELHEECMMETLPQTAVDYIYKDIDWKRSCSQYRDDMMNRVLKDGYMKTVLKQVGIQVIMNRIKNYLVDTRLWRIIKRK